MLNIPIWTLFAPSLKAVAEKMTPRLIMKVSPKSPKFRLIFMFFAQMTLKMKVKVTHFQ